MRRLLAFSLPFFLLLLLSSFLLASFRSPFIFQVCSLPVRRIDSRCTRAPSSLDPNSLVHRTCRGGRCLSMVCASRSSTGIRDERSRACDATKGLINCTLGTGPPFEFDPPDSALNLRLTRLSRVFVISLSVIPRATTLSFNHPFSSPPLSSFFFPLFRFSRNHLSRSCRSPLSDSPSHSRRGFNLRRSLCSLCPRANRSLANLGSFNTIGSRRGGVGGSNRRSARFHTTRWLAKARRTIRRESTNPAGKFPRTGKATEALAVRA